MKTNEVSQGVKVGGRREVRGQEVGSDRQASGMR